MLQDRSLPTMPRVLWEHVSLQIDKAAIVYHVLMPDMAFMAFMADLNPPKGQLKKRYVMAESNSAIL